MSKSSQSSHHHDAHDWHSPNYVAQWAEGQDPKEMDRQEPFRLLAETLPYGLEEPVRILDVGAGYGALTQFLLARFPAATAVCQDGSQEMAKLGLERMKNFVGRFTYVHSDFAQPGWNRDLNGSFDAAVSSIAIHNVRQAEIIRRIYGEIFPLVKAGGCFLNFDRPHPPVENQLEWLEEAGFDPVKCFWKDESRALFGGFKK